MRIKILGVVLVCSFLLFTSQQTLYAKKKLPSRGKIVGGGVGAIVSPKLRGDRLALIVNFGSLSRVTSVSYTLSYNTNGIPQGVVGTITPTQDTTQRELLFGTCSAGVCRYHTNLTNMKFVVTSNLKSGKRAIKTFRVKI
ncbi:MAG: Uncharacterized protein LiPW16_291 [Microgenomates group bacterium LiPW_16]|nr:MAG: Uncharacterized protein LiPW16_291 [Microgenomates group bacterium LiPW_16]